MRTRQALIADLLAYQRPLREVIRDLDRTRPAPVSIHALAAATRATLSAMLARVERGEIQFRDLVEWAKEVELIDDIDRELGHEEEVSQMLFEMATPEIDVRSEAQRLAEWRSRLP